VGFTHSPSTNPRVGSAAGRRSRANSVSPPNDPGSGFVSRLGKLRTFLPLVFRSHLVLRHSPRRQPQHDRVAALSSGASRRYLITVSQLAESHWMILPERPGGSRPMARALHRAAQRNQPLDWAAGSTLPAGRASRRYPGERDPDPMPLEVVLELRSEVTGAHAIEPLVPVGTFSKPGDHSRTVRPPALGDGRRRLTAP
jgi:hypothetical protein